MLEFCSVFILIFVIFQLGLKNSGSHLLSDELKTTYQAVLCFNKWFYGLNTMNFPNFCVFLVLWWHWILVQKCNSNRLFWCWCWKRAFEQLYLSQWIAYCFHGSNHFSTDFYSVLKFFVYLMSFLLSQDSFLILIGCICFFCNIFSPSELETAQVSYPGCISDRFLLSSHRTNEHITFFRRIANYIYGVESVFSYFLWMFELAWFCCSFHRLMTWTNKK